MKREQILALSPKKRAKCPSCFGTGETHSHNSRCWDCHGIGEVAAVDAPRLQRELVEFCRSIRGVGGM